MASAACRLGYLKSVFGSVLYTTSISRASSSLGLYPITYVFMIQLLNDACHSPKSGEASIQHLHSQEGEWMIHRLFKNLQITGLCYRKIKE